MLLRLLLFPFSVIYNAVTFARNKLYDRGLLKFYQAKIPTIGLGNLTVGGTGKSPHTEHILRLTAKRKITAVLSRGYGRKTTGFLQAGTESDARQIGDEPLQIYRKFQPEVEVYVCENRPVGVKKIREKRPKTELILLDDVYQHRPLKTDLLILMNDFNRPFYRDFLLPAGRLRESRKGGRRADAVIVSKCPAGGLSESEKKQIYRDLRKYIRPEIPVFFSTISYDKPQNLFNNSEWKNDFNLLIVSGIAQKYAFEKYAEKHFRVLAKKAFADHHDYSPSDLKEICGRLKKTGPESVLLTTEKDAVKWLRSDLAEILAGIPVFYLPVRPDFGAQSSDFEAFILNFLKK